MSQVCSNGVALSAVEHKYIFHNAVTVDSSRGPLYRNDDLIVSDKWQANQEFQSSNFHFYAQFFSYKCWVKNQAKLFYVAWKYGVSPEAFETVTRELSETGFVEIGRICCVVRLSYFGVEVERGAETTFSELKLMIV